MFLRFSFGVKLFLITKNTISSYDVACNTKNYLFCASANYKTIDLHRLMLTKRFHNRDNQKTLNEFPKGFEKPKSFFFLLSVAIKFFLPSVQSALHSTNILRVVPQGPAKFSARNVNNLSFPIKNLIACSRSFYSRKKLLPDAGELTVGIAGKRSFTTLY